MEPKGAKFWDDGNGRWCKYVTEGPWKGWLVFQHPDGQWVSWREATPDDLRVINKAMVAAHNQNADGN